MSFMDEMDNLREEAIKGVAEQIDEEAIRLLQSIGIKTTKPRYIKGWLKRKGYEMVISPIEPKYDGNRLTFTWEQYLRKKEK